MKERVRRQILKGLAISAPVVWAKPVVDSVVLPVHAETSPCADLIVRVTGISVSCPGGAGTCVSDINIEIENIGLADTDSFSVLVSLNTGDSNSVVIPSLAAGATTNTTVTVGPGDNCFNPNCTATATVDNLAQIAECDEQNNSGELTVPG